MSLNILKRSFPISDFREKSKNNRLITNRRLITVNYSNECTENILKNIFSLYMLINYVKIFLNIL
jgi:hypothetical protein